jgi:hypothetical protein
LTPLFYCTLYTETLLKMVLQMVVLAHDRLSDNGLELARSLTATPQIEIKWGDQSAWLVSSHKCQKKRLRKTNHPSTSTTKLLKSRARIRFADPAIAFTPIALALFTEQRLIGTTKTELRFCLIPKGGSRISKMLIATPLHLNCHKETTWFQIGYRPVGPSHDSPENLLQSMKLSFNVYLR